MDGISADDLCARVNAALSDLAYDFTEDDDELRLTIAGGRPVRFPREAGGQVQGGSGTWIVNKHANGAVHEPGLVATLVALAGLRPDVRTLFDIGALYGYVSLVARSLFANADAHAFEVNPNSYRALRRNFAANAEAFGDSLVAHHCALSNETDRDARLRIHKFHIERAGAAEGRGREHDVPVWTLDDFCDEHRLSPDVIKMDVEGYQAKIVPGAMGVIRRSRPVVLLEFDAPGSVNSFGVTNHEVIQPLLDDGYRLVWGRHRRRDLPFRVLDASELGPQHEVNSLGILVP